jgi:hypothetical protein
MAASIAVQATKPILLPCIGSERASIFKLHLGGPVFSMALRSSAGMSDWLPRHDSYRPVAPVPSR